MTYFAKKGRQSQADDTAFTDHGLMGLYSGDDQCVENIGERRIRL